MKKLMYDTSMSAMNRRQVVQGVAGTVLTLAAGLDELALTGTAQAKSSIWRNTSSARLRTVRVGAAITVPDNFGDTFVTTLGDDGNLYTPSNDTLGFDIAPYLTEQQIKLKQSDFPKFIQHLNEEQKNLFRYSPIAFNRIEGDDPQALRGVTINRMLEYLTQDHYRAMLDDPSDVGAADGRTWKSAGCAFIDGTMYWTLHRDKDGAQGLRQTARDSSIIKSTDYGKTWSGSAAEHYKSPMFPGSIFPTPYFMDYGTSGGSVHGADRYVYAISNNGFWDNGDDLILGRVLRARIGLLKRTDWQFYRGGNGMSDTSWTHEAAGARPILQSPGRLGETGAVYLPDRQRYLLIGWYYPGGGGFTKGASSTTVWDFYEAPEPWGPWTCIDSHTWSPQGYYCPIVCPKFQSADKVYVVTAGDFMNWWQYYHLTFVPLDLT